MYFLLLLKLFSILHSSSASYPSLPPPPFLAQFAEEHDRSSIMICIPNVMNTKMIHEHRMQMARYEKFSWFDGFLVENVKWIIFLQS